MSGNDKGAKLTVACGQLRGGGWWRLAIGVVLALLVTACGGGGNGADDGQRGSDGSRPRHWVLLGSSTAAGVGATPGQAWASRLDTALRARTLTLDNRARGGATTYHALPMAAPRPAGRPSTDMRQDVALALLGEPSALVLAFPSNDAVNGYAPSESLDNLLLMRDLARARGVPVIVLSSQPRDDANGQAQATMLATDAALVAALGACFVAVRDDLADPLGRIAPRFAAGDGVHLNDAGHALIFERLWATVNAGRCLNPP